MSGEPDGSARSYLTVMVYLNSGGGQDFDGGETRFVQVLAGKQGEARGPMVTPHVGDVLVFTHPVLHESKAVTKGRKYVLRTEVMYAR